MAETYRIALTATGGEVDQRARTAAAVAMATEAVPIMA
ncbi:hypothetical protein D554_0266 [Bordetella holmesii 30539]|nr:hypothetical protein D554_0266 [Bordetella holmesii 30539]